MTAVFFAASLIAAWVYRGHIGCYSLYPECNPIYNIPEMPTWSVPTNPVEKEGYDFAHSLHLPDGVPKAVPFDFKAARIKAVSLNLSAFEVHQALAADYFKHLCETEAGLTVFKTASDVEGVLLLRSERRDISDSWTHDRYDTEDALSMTGNYLSSGTQWDGYNGPPEQFIQPLHGHYRFLEVYDSSGTDKLWRFQREINHAPPYGFRNGVDTSQLVNGRWNKFRLPFMVVKTSVSNPEAKYAITWRGVRRPRDREFAIAVSEMIVLDHQTNEVMAVNREFSLSGRDIRPSGVWWSNAKSCYKRKNPSFSYRFNANEMANRVLKPIASINESLMLDSKNK